MKLTAQYKCRFVSFWRALSRLRECASFGFEAKGFAGSGLRCTVGRLVPAILSLAVLGCSPSQEGNDQCPEFNVNLTGFKDSVHEGATIAEVDALISAYMSTSWIPGCAVGIVKDNQIYYLKAYGSADLGDVNNLGDEVPFTISTPSSLGSISKTITALAVLRLHDQGHLDIDDEISDYLSVPVAWTDFTIRELLSHTTGLDNMPTPDYPLDEALMLAECPGAVHPGLHPRCAQVAYETTPIVGFPAGTTMWYSNTGYMLLGSLIDTVTTDVGFGGVQGYETHVWHSIGLRGGNLSSPNMISMALNADWRQNDIKNLAKDYRPIRDENDDTIIIGLEDFPPKGFTGAEGPAGGWTMTIGDLSRLMIAINTDKLIAPATKTEMMTAHGATDVVSSYGLGVYMKTELSMPAFLHSGQYEGYKARYIMWPSENFGVAVMVNREKAGLVSLTRNIAELFVDGAGFGDGPEKIVQEPNNAVYEVVSNHESTIRCVVESLWETTGGDGATVAARLRDVISVFGTGSDVLRMFDSGDFESAAVQLLPILDSTVVPAGQTGCPFIIPGDFDYDADVDPLDYDAFDRCGSGPAIPYAVDCGLVDFDKDDDVDQADFGVFQRCISGENNPADPSCAE